MIKLLLSLCVVAFAAVDPGAGDLDPCMLEMAEESVDFVDTIHCIDCLNSDSEVRKRFSWYDCDQMFCAIEEDFE